MPQTAREGIDVVCFKQFLVRFGVRHFRNLRLASRTHGITVRKRRTVAVTRPVVFKVFEAEGLAEGFRIRLCNLLFRTVEAAVLIYGIRLVLDAPVRQNLVLVRQQVVEILHDAFRILRADGDPYAAVVQDGGSRY